MLVEPLESERYIGGTTLEKGLTDDVLATRIGPVFGSGSCEDACRGGSSQTPPPIFYRRHFKKTVCGYVKKDGTKVQGALPAEKHGLRFHDLRQTAASLTIHAGGHPLLVSKMLGHGRVEMTLNRYSHLMPDVAEALATELDAIYRAAPRRRNRSRN